MIRLGSNTDPVWHDLVPGVRVAFRPYDVVPEQVAWLEHPSDPADSTADAREKMVLRLIDGVAGHVVAWEGVGDEDGEPLPCTRENVARLLHAHGGCFNAAVDAFTGHRSAWDAEKKGSRTARRGSATAAASTAEDAPRSTSDAHEGEATTTAGSAP